MKKKLKGFSAVLDDTLPAPIMVDAKKSAGLNREALFNPTTNLTVRIPFGLEIKIDTVIDLFWGKVGDEANAKNITFTPKTVSVDDIIFAHKDIFVNTAQIDISDGEATVFYTLTEPSGSNVIKSLPVNFLVKTTVPGDIDPDPTTPYVNENLPAPKGIPQEVNTENINSISVTIDAYKNMSIGDKVTLSWAGVENSSHVVKDTDVNKPIIIPVDEDVIKRAGDYEEAIIRYDIRDTVNNWSLWSVPSFVDIDIEDSIFVSPGIQGAVDGVLTIDDLNGKDVHILILPYTGIKLGDELRLKWAGGQLLPNEITHTLTGSEKKYGYAFIVPFSQIRGMGGEMVTVYYEVNGKTSKKTNVIINGNPFTLPAPVAPQAKSGILDLNTIPITDHFLVRLNQDLTLVEDDVVTLYVAGTTPEGETIDLFNQIHPVTALDVGKILVIPIERNKITSMAGGGLTITYTVKGKMSEDISSSYPLELMLAKLNNNLPAPILVEMIDMGTLNPVNADANGEVHIVVGNYPDKARGDEILCRWVGKTTYTPPEAFVPKAVNGVFKDNIFTIPKSVVQDNIGSWVSVSYEADNIDGDIMLSNALIFNIMEALPAPTVDQAVGNMVILAQVPSSGATVTIPAEARLTESDAIVLSWTGRTPSETTSVGHNVTAAEAGKSLSLTIPREIVFASIDELITVGYTITRSKGVQGTFESPENSYSVVSVLPARKLQVMGARFSPGASYGFGTVGAKYIVALSSDTHKSLDDAEWQYAGDAGWTSGSYFRDVAPERVLRVRAADDVVTLSGCNVVGNGVTVDPAFAVRRNSGHIVAWGSAALGGEIPPTLMTLDDIVSVCAAETAFAALRSTGHVVSWGEAPYGTIPASIAGIANITQIAASGYAFAALRDDGSVIAWGGSASQGGVVPADIAVLRNIKRIVGGNSAFVAFLETGEITSWGGLVLPSEIKQLTDIIDVQSTLNSFVALRKNNTVVGWGIAIPANIAAMNDIVELMASTNNSFVAKRRNGALVAWGGYGGIIPENIAGLTDIVDVVSSNNTYIALRKNGTAVCWGKNTDIVNGISNKVSTLDDIVQLCATEFAAAVLRANGEVVAWGNTAYGGNASAVQASLTDVRALYSTSTAFLALTKDNRVVTWGDPTGGGDSSAVQQYIAGQLSYEMVPR